MLWDNVSANLRPTASELAQLTDALRRDPGSDVFVMLGNAYLALGRAQEAVEVGARGLKRAPSNIDGRMMVSRAFMALHQWKQAQAELLKVVKADRTNHEGFTMLGEVLMRRADFERALPVLQHAQNLDPANPAVLALLKSARAGRPLAPPPPVPTPSEPVAAPAVSRSAPAVSRPAPAVSRSAPAGPRPKVLPPPSFGVGLDDAPTRVAGARGGLDIGDATDLTSSRMDQTEPALPPAMAHDAGDETEQVVAPSISARLPLGAPSAPAPPAARSKRPSAPPPPPARPRSKRPSAPPPRSKRPSAPPPQAAPTVRPRIIPAEKPKDAARAGLRQSAAMGENYLNNLLVSGLLDVPNVRVPSAAYDLKAGKLWGRSTKRAFIVLFVLMALGFGGGGYWYHHAKKQRAADVARHLATARGLIQSGKFDDLRSALTEVSEALKRDKTHVEAMAVFAEIGGLSALLYRTEADRADLAATTADKQLKGKGKGVRAVVVARAALTLALLSDMDGPVDRLADARKQVDDWLAGEPDDGWMRWLQGRSMLAAGDLSGAAAAFDRARKGGKGPVVATIDRADMYLDVGQYDEAMKLYDAATMRAPNHPLALIGRSLTRAERSAESSETMDDLNVGLAADKGVRVLAYKNLALAYSHYVLEDYVAFKKSLGKAIGLREPRFLARVALGKLLIGDIVGAADIRARITWYGKGAPEKHPLVSLLDAELLLAFGNPTAALTSLGSAKELRAYKLRGRAYMDLNQPAKALVEFEAALKIAEEDLDALVWEAAARMLTKRGGARRKASRDLDKLRRKAKSKAPLYIHGMALLKTGNRSEARRKFVASLDGVGDEYPNPLAYRAHVELAALDMAANKRSSSAKHLEKALTLNAGYLRAHAVLGLLYLSGGKYSDASSELSRVVAEGAANTKILLAFAEAMARATPKLSATDRARVKAALTRAKDLGADAAELARVAALADPALPAELGLEAPKGGAAPSGSRRRR